MNFIIFRLDRIGDFLVSSILINDIKKKNKNAKFTIVCSEKNFEYIKKSHLVDRVLLMPNNLIDRIKFYFYMFRKQYDNSLVLDGKKKSIITSLLIKSNQNILITNKKLFKFLFNYFFDKIYFIKIEETKINEILYISDYLKNNFNINSMFYANKHVNIPNNYTKLINVLDSYILFHFDEKWIFNEYIKSYSNIEPSNLELLSFIKKISVQTDKNLIITTGIKDNKLVRYIKSISEKTDNSLYRFKVRNNYVYLADSLDIFSLEYLISMSSCVITCHGATSHLSNMYKKKLVDIIDFSEDKIFKKWNNHFVDYKIIYRTNFNDISKKIITCL